MNDWWATVGANGMALGFRETAIGQVYPQENKHVKTQLRPPMWRRYKKILLSQSHDVFKGEMDYKPWLISFIPPYFLQSQIN